MAPEGFLLNHGPSERILKGFSVRTNPPGIQFGCFITGSISHTRNDEKQHGQDVDEVGFCDLMFLMKREGHAVKIGKMHTTHCQQIIISFV